MIFNKKDKELKQCDFCGFFHDSCKTESITDKLNKVMFEEEYKDITFRKIKREINDCLYTRYPMFSDYIDIMRISNDDIFITTSGQVLVSILYKPLNMIYNFNLSAIYNYCKVDRFKKDVLSLVNDLIKAIHMHLIENLLEINNIKKELIAKKELITKIDKIKEVINDV